MNHDTHNTSTSKDHESLPKMLTPTIATDVLRSDCTFCLTPTVHRRTWIIRPLLNKYLVTRSITAKFDCVSHRFPHCFHLTTTTSPPDRYSPHTLLDMERWVCCTQSNRPIHPNRSKIWYGNPILLRKPNYNSNNIVCYLFIQTCCISTRACGIHTHHS